MTLEDGNGEAAWRQAVIGLIRDDDPDARAEALAVCEALAVERAGQTGRLAVPLDVVLAGSLLCWLPFKPARGEKFEGSVFEASALEARAVVLTRGRRGDRLVESDAGWLRMPTDEILYAMGDPGREIPRELFG